MSVLYVDVVGGAAGDMLLAALFDAGARRGPVVEAVSSVLGRPVDLTTTEVRRGGLRAMALNVSDEVGDASASRRGPLELIAALERASLEPGVRARAISVLARLGDAEARVHGIALEALELDELGEDDTLVDVVGVAAALESLGVERIAVSSLPMPPPSGGGKRTGRSPEHVAHAVPAPVTLELLRGFAVRPSPAGSEMTETITPTAAAIFAALGESVPEIPELTVERVGYGAGERDPSGVANVVRVLLGAPAASRVSDGRRLLVLEANVDDLTPELVPDAVEALMSAGALDAWATPIVMKRGRPAITISALCDPNEQVGVRRAFFESTSTFGVRVHEVVRPELERRTVEVELAEGGPRVRVKVGLLDGRAVSAKPEHADVVEAALKLGRSVRSVHAQASALAHGLLEDPPGAVR
ncbi:MAG: nickel pincer cofactor biosynthesis protein LarC [Actinomycetota bacterium]